MLIETLMWLCLQGVCIQVRPEAVAVAMCESGDTQTMGTGSWNAMNDNPNGTTDGGAWQFNDFFVWSMDDFWVIRPVAEKLGLTPKEFLHLWPSGMVAPPEIQYLVFEHLWDNGRGAWHWNASKPCWSKAIMNMEGWNNGTTANN